MTLLSASIIARDEAANLPRCIRSLTGLVDEVVVYDTGSVDDTLAVAAAEGARTVAGAWPGSFAAARNAALKHCRGSWVLSIDADEEVRCFDADAFRKELVSAPPRVRVLQLSIDNATGAGVGTSYAHVADRLFRRRGCRWRGRVHEQLVDSQTGELVPAAWTDALRLLHHGYSGVDPAKLQRNLRLAEAEVADPSFGDRGIALVWLGRALWALDRGEEALRALRDGAASTSNPTARRQGLATAARVALRMDDLAGAAELVAALRRVSHKQVAADVLQAGVALAAGRPQESLALLGQVTEVVRDDDGYEHSPLSVAEWHAAALVAAGLPDAAADLLIGLLRNERVLAADLDLVVEALERTGRSSAELAAAVPSELLPAVVAGAVRLDPPRGSRLLQALWDRADRDSPSPDAMTVLAGAALLARRLSADEALVWAKRLRTLGLVELCPLAAVATDPSVPPRRRVEAASLARRVFDDQRAAGWLADAATGLSEEAARSVLSRCDPDDAAMALTYRRRACSPTTRRAGGMSSPRVSVVVVANRGAARVQECMLALANSLPADLSFEVVVVDPGSTDGTAALLDGLSGDVTVIRTSGRISLGTARNLGAASANGEILVCVDGIVRFHGDWLPPLIEALEADVTLGAVAPALEARPGRLPLAGGRLTWQPASPGAAAGFARCPWKPTADEPSARVVPCVVPDRPEGVVRVDVVVAPVVAVRRRALAEVGGFDDGYWEAAGDVDLCLALRHRGWGIGCQPLSVVEAADGGTPVAARWAARDPRKVPFAEGSGLHWQNVDNAERLATRWAESANQQLQ